MPSCRAAAAAVLLVVPGTACTGGGKSALPTPSASHAAPPRPSASPCPPVPATRPAWPSDVPADLPLPESAKITKNERTTGNLRVLHFDVPWSLHESVVHVVNRFPPAGYVVGRGDAEPTEADAPFHRDDIRGLVRIFLTGTCKTLWLLAVGRSDTSIPYNSSHSPRPSASSLPFG